MFFDLQASKSVLIRSQYRYTVVFTVIEMSSVWENNC